MNYSHSHNYSSSQSQKCPINYSHHGNGNGNGNGHGHGHGHGHQVNNPNHNPPQQPPSPQNYSQHHYAPSQSHSHSHSQSQIQIQIQSQSQSQSQPIHSSDLSPSELAALFRAVDKDNDGEIDARELQAALSNGSFAAFNPNLCGLMIHIFDKRGGGTIQQDEFGALWRYVHDWQSCFRSFDQDGSGEIDYRELHNALSAFGYRLSPSICHMLMNKFDRQGKQTLLFDDFIQCCIVLYTVTGAFKDMDRDRDGYVTMSYEQFVNIVITIAVNSC